MKKTIYPLLTSVFVLFPAASFAAGSFASAPQSTRTRIFECNIVSGEYQAIAVYQQGEELTLSALDSQGFRTDYALPAAQWEEQNISVPCAYWEGRYCGHIYFDQGRWVYRIGSMGSYSMGMCR